MMLEFRNLVPVVTPLGEGYALYVTHGGHHDNDIWCVILDDSRILHFQSAQLRHVGNATLEQKRPEPSRHAELVITPAASLTLVQMRCAHSETTHLPAIGGSQCNACQLVMPRGWNVCSKMGNDKNGNRFICEKHWRHKGDCA